MDPEPDLEPEERDSSPFGNDTQMNRSFDSYHLADAPSRVYLMTRLTNELAGYGGISGSPERHSDTDADIDMFRLFSIDDHNSSSNPGVNSLGDTRNIQRHSSLRNAANRHISIIDNQLVQHHRQRRERRARQLRANRQNRDNNGNNNNNAVINITRSSVEPSTASLQVHDEEGYADTSTSDESYIEDGMYGFTSDFNEDPIEDEDEEENDNGDERERVRDDDDEQEEEDEYEHNTDLDDLLTSENIARELNDRSSYELSRSETRRDGLVRVNTIKRHKPNSSRDELRKDLIIFYEKHAKELSMLKRVVLGTDIPILSCIRRHYDIKSYVLTKEMNSFLDRSRSNRLFLTNKRKLSERILSKRAKLNPSKGQNKEYKKILPETSSISSSDVDGKTTRNDYKEKILNVTYNSFLTVGSSFKVRLNDKTNLQFVVMMADYTTKDLMFLVTVLPTKETKYSSHLSTFVKHFFENRFESNTRDLVNIILETVKDVDTIKDDSELFNFLISGKMIDFKNRDLRTSMNMHRKYLSKWLNLPPFKRIMVPHLTDALRKVTNPKFEKQTTSLFQQLYSICRLLSDFQSCTSLFDLKNYSFDSIISDLHDVQKKHRIGVIDKVFDTAFMNFIICEHCLFRLQSECIPFDLEINDNILTQLGDFISRKFGISDNKQSKYHKIKDRLIAKSAIMIGSLDRRNGDFYLYNTRVSTVPSPYTRSGNYAYDKSPDGLNDVMNGHYMRTTDHKSSSTTGGGHQTFRFL